MKICAAQTRPVKGNIQQNIINHKKLIELALSHGADAIIFPELSITGYEPGLANELATNEDDSRFNDFQKISDNSNITIGIGVPTKQAAGVCISMVIFQPDKPRQTYSKKYMHSSEDDFFVSGQNRTNLTGSKNNIAIAICYELSVAEHSENAFKNGATIYAASVVESVNGVDKALKNLSGIGNKYSMTVLMANCIGQTGIYNCPGKSSVWNSKGELLGQLNDEKEGIIMVDTETEEIIKASLITHSPSDHLIKQD
jgi:predicted amidohydrolase